jgi:hypothetical protein
MDVIGQPPFPAACILLCASWAPSHHHENTLTGWPRDLRQRNAIDCAKFGRMVSVARLSVRLRSRGGHSSPRTTRHQRRRFRDLCRGVGRKLFIRQGAANRFLGHDNAVQLCTEEWSIEFGIEKY